MNFLPYLSTIVTFAFTIAVYNRYRQRGGMHLLLWAFGLLLYGIGTLCEVILGLTFSVFALEDLVSDRGDADRGLAGDGNGSFAGSQGEHRP